MTEQEIATHLIQTANDIKKLQISHLVLMAAVARELHPNSRDQAISFVKSAMELEREFLATEPTLKGYDLALRALMSWHVAES